MSQLSKSLEKRIQELTTSIEAQKTELAAYERVLHMELTKDSAPTETASSAPEAAKESSHTRTAPTKAAIAEKEPQTPSADTSDIPFTGNKTTLVAEIVKSLGSAGATPKDVDAFFTARNVERSKNLIYNTLSYLVAQKKLQRRDGKYFIAGGTDVAKKTATPAATKKAPTKRRLSPEGLKRIKEALRKRWAAKRAAEAAAGKPATKTATKKK
jgi:hypothetical protein